MSTITTINSTDVIANSRTTINNNFTNLNTDKAELSGGTFTGDIAFSGTTHAGIKANSLSTTQRDALVSPANGMIIYNSTANQMQVYENGTWNAATAAATNASTIVKGIVQEGTQAEVDAKTTAGSTAARLYVNPSTLRSTLLSDYVVDTGAADAYIITPSPAITAYAVGQRFTFKASATNTTSSTVAVNGLAAKTIKKNDGATNLAAGDIVSGQIVEIEYNATSDFFQMMSPAATTVNLVAGAYPAASGAAITGIRNAYDYQAFTSSGTWTKPSGLAGTEMVKVQAWGGGGAGGGVASNNNNYAAGGGGGSFIESIFRVSDLGSTVTVTIGAAGTPGAAGANSGGAGGNTTFGSLVTAYGGGGGAGSNNASASGGGGGGGLMSAGGSVTVNNNVGGSGGSPVGGAASSPSSLGGGGGGTSASGGLSAYGGGGGGAGNSASVGGNSLYGGGGGGGANGAGSNAGGTALTWGGNGGAGAGLEGVGTSGTAPGGGGGGSGTAVTTNRAGGAGARGECRVWVMY